jgi:hypothetical protein
MWLQRDMSNEKQTMASRAYDSKSAVISRCYDGASLHLKTRNAHEKGCPRRSGRRLYDVLRRTGFRSAAASSSSGLP